MTEVAVLGAGAGGAAGAVELMLAGHSVRLWSRSPATIDAFRQAGGIRYRGRLGEGLAAPHLVTNDLEAALRGAEVALACLPAPAHRGLFQALAALGLSVPLILNPGGVGGSLEALAVFAEEGTPLPALAEFSTLTYVARMSDASTVNVTGVAKRVWVGSLPGSAEAESAARELYPIVAPAGDVLYAALANVNLVLHPPGAVLGAAWVEATAGDFRFYVEGMTSGVARVLAALDLERLAVGRSYGHDLAPLVEEMAAIGTADREAVARGDVVESIRGGGANSAIRAPSSFDHRYYREDFGFGLLPFCELARVAGIAVPVAEALLRLGAVLVGPELEREGRDALRMGIAGRSKGELIAMVRGS